MIFYINKKRLITKTICQLGFRCGQPSPQPATTASGFDRKATRNPQLHIVPSVTGHFKYKTMNKLILLIIGVIILFSCSQKSKDLNINLQSENGYGVFMPGRKIIFPNIDSIENRGIPNDIKEFVVRSMPLQGAQYYWD